MICKLLNYFVLLAYFFFFILNLYIFLYYKNYISKYVMVVCKVIVSTSLSSVTDKTYSLRFCIILIIIQSIITPICSVRKRTRNKCIQLSLIIFSLEESSLLQYKTVIVTINYISYSKFLIQPCRVCSIFVVCNTHITTTRVHEIISII